MHRGIFCDMCCYCAITTNGSLTYNDFNKQEDTIHPTGEHLSLMPSQSFFLHVLLFAFAEIPSQRQSPDSSEAADRLE